MNRAKENLRQKLRARRLALTPAEVAAKSSAIVDKLINAVDWSKIKKVHIYWSNPDWREVDTSKLINWLSNNHPSVKVDQPSQDKSQPLPNEQYDLIIVPVLGFDSDNNRLGLGGGYYDRFLAGQRQALKIGVAYRASLVDAGLPREPHDIRLDMVITEV